MIARNPRRRPVVTAAFAASWDGRLIEVLPPTGPVDAQLSSAAPPGPALKRLHAQGARRVAFSGGSALFRELMAGGLLDELSIAWRPRIGGGGQPISGMDGAFLPRGIVLDLVTLDRHGDECVARYRVRNAAH